MLVLQLNAVSAQSATGIKFLANIISRGDAILPAYDATATDTAVTVWLSKEVAGKPLATIVESRIAEAKSAGRVYHLALTDYRVELDKPTAGKDSKRIFQSLEIKPTSGAKVSGEITERLVLEIGDL